MESTQKDNQIKSASTTKPFPIDIKDYKPPKTSLELKTPSVTVNLLSEAFNTENNQLKDTQQKSSQNTSRSLYSYSARHKYPKVEAFSITKTPLTFQSYSTRGNSFISNTSKSPSQRTLPKPKNEKRLNTMGSPAAQSLCSSPRAFKSETEGLKVPVFPSKANSLTDKNLKRSASEHKIIPVSAASTKGENSYKFPDEQKNRPIIPRPVRKTQTTQRKISTNTIETPLKTTPKIQSKIPNERNETPNRTQGLQTNSPRLNSAQSYSQKLKGDLGIPDDPQMKTPKGKIKENKTPLRAAKSLASLQAKNSTENNRKGLALNKVSSTKPPSSAKKEIILNCKSEADLDKEIRNKTEASSPVMKKESSSLTKLNTEQERPVSNFYEDLHSIKTTYFQPIEDFKLNEFIQNVKNSHQGSAKSQHKNINRETDIENNNRNIKQEKPPLSVSSFTAGLPSATVLSERNNNMDKNPNPDKQTEEKILKQRQINHGENINIEIKVSKVDVNTMQTPKEVKRCNSKDHLLTVKQGKFNETKRDSNQKENLLKSARLRPTENFSSEHESLSVSKASRRSLLAKVYGDKLSPKGPIASQEAEANTYSKLDQLLKNFKGEKVERITEKENIKDKKDMKEGLFAPDFGDEEEAPVVLSNLKKSLAKILIKNEN